MCLDRNFCLQDWHGASNQGVYASLRPAQRGKGWRAFRLHPGSLHINPLQQNFLLPQSSKYERLSYIWLYGNKPLTSQMSKQMTAYWSTIGHFTRATTSVMFFLVNMSFFWYISRKPSKGCGHWHIAQSISNPWQKKYYWNKWLPFPEYHAVLPWRIQSDGQNKLFSKRWKSLALRNGHAAKWHFVESRSQKAVQKKVSRRWMGPVVLGRIYQICVTRKLRK